MTAKLTETDIQRFYNGKTIFLTGGTGFLGKVFIERILRATNVKCILLLIRGKKGKSVQDRVADMLSEPLFEKLRSQRNDLAERIIPINGDCLQKGLGISTQDRNFVIDNVNVVMHSAATVRFNEPLATAVAINVRATFDLMELAKEMRHLESYVHVSSAFANCVELQIDEHYYPENLNGYKAKEVCRMSDEDLDAKSTELCGKYPNTYCFTKALAEDAVLSEGAGLPICIFRPGIVVPSFKDPMPGWIDNLFGPTAIVLGGLCGVMRVVYVSLEKNASLVPVDYCASMMIATAWQTAQTKVNVPTIGKISEKPIIYNFVPFEGNLLKWGQYINGLTEHGMKMPLVNTLWYPFIIMTQSRILYNILWILYHTIPAYIADLGLLLLGKQRKLVDMYRKIYRQTSVLDYFVDKTWHFDTKNTRRLWEQLSKEDRMLFDFDMSSINWPEYLRSCIVGIRAFLGKEDASTIPKALSRLKIFKFLHYTLQSAILASFFAAMLLVV